MKAIERTYQRPVQPLHDQVRRQTKRHFGYALLGLALWLAAFRLIFYLICLKEGQP